MRAPRPPPRHPEYRYDDIDKDQRECFEGLLKDQLEKALREMDIGRLSRKLAVAFLTPKLVKLLEKM